MKTAVQLDFDGTVTEEDVSYLLLDTYAGAGWRKHLEDYESGIIPVGTFNRRVFGMVTASREEMVNLVINSPKVKVRPGFREFIDYCRNSGFYTEITSNGLMFYIEAILKAQGISGLPFHAAENEFYEGGVKVRYVGPAGTEVEDDFKTEFTRELRRQGYNIIYAGNGKSDFNSARLCDHVFATEDLLERCRLEKLPCIPFRDFNDVLAGMKSLFPDR